MARLFEYQGKKLLRDVGIPTPEGSIADTPQSAYQIANSLDRPVVLKAQAWTTGRLKTGGIRFATTPEEAEETASELLGMDLKSFKVKKILVEEKLDIQQEYYIGIIINDSHEIRAPELLISLEGGIDIEEFAKESPEKIFRQRINILRGLRIYEIVNLVQKLGGSSDQLMPLASVILGLYDVFRNSDAKSAEINPLVVTKQGKLYAVDCRISIDDSSVHRHPKLGIEFPRESDTPPTDLDRIAWRFEAEDFRGVSFFAQMTDDISDEKYVGYHAIGGGGALLAADGLTRAGLKLANFAETSGNPPASKVYRIAKVILSQPQILGYCLLGAVIASQDQWHHSHGLVKAFREELIDRPGFPVVILLAGNKEEEALDIIRKGLEGLPIKLELYGRDYVYKLDFIADRMKSLVEEYQNGECN